jgi:hypothetical protein
MPTYQETLKLLNDAYSAGENRQVFNLSEAARALSADRGEAVCFRFQLQTGEWSRWLSMEDLVHYGPDGNLVDGPHPDWKRVEYAYAATPPSPAESAVDGRFPAPIRNPEAWPANYADGYNDALRLVTEEGFARPAAPSGVSDAMVERAWHLARNAWMAASRHGTQEAADQDAIHTLTAALAIQPQPGRVEGVGEPKREVVDYNYNGDPVFSNAATKDAKWNTNIK